MEKIEIKHALKEIVKNSAQLEFCTRGKLFYSVIVENVKYIFPVDVTNLEDVGTAIFELSYTKSITLMRYLRKAIDSDEIRIEIIKP